MKNHQLLDEMDMKDKIIISFNIFNVQYKTELFRVSSCQVIYKIKLIL